MPSRKIIKCFLFAVLISGFFSNCEGQQGSAEQSEVGSYFVFAEEPIKNPKVEINFFYGAVCPRCAQEKIFLEKIEKKYENVKINKLGLAEKENVQLLKKMYEDYQVPEQSQGLVPITFIKERYFLGYRNEQTTGAEIENYVLELLEKTKPSSENTSNFFQELGLFLPLPLFTSIIALIDGFNPCTIWVLSFLLILLISVSENRKRIFVVGFTFVTVIFITYFLFMAAWLNVFRFIGFIDPIRITIAVIAIIAGLINCKEMFAFRKGPTLMIQSRNKPALLKKIDKVKNVIKYGSLPALIGASIILAGFASLIELPCTAGWPIIYTGILAGQVLSQSASYYFYLLFYNLIYIIPLSIIILLFGWFFKGKQISKQQMQIIKLISGLIMIALGIILLVNPDLLTLIK